MVEHETHVVTGAFGFSGRHIAERLLARGVAVRTLTGHPDRPNPFGDAIAVAPFRFDDPSAMAESMRGASVLYNTYWIRFERGASTFARAVANTQALIRAAREAGVRRIVHVSITNPSLDSPLPYFSGKARLERDVIESGIEYAILRPAVIFGDQGVLINNVAWLLRRFPLFAVPGSGDYRLQPIFVDDLADLAVQAGAGHGNSMVDAIGPETFTFNDLANVIRRAVRSRALIAHMPPMLALQLSRVIGLAVRDVVLTSDDVHGLVADLLVTNSQPAGQTKLSEWLESNHALVGKRWVSELGLHYR
jgi:NADH dehydrogenase